MATTEGASNHPVPSGKQYPRQGQGKGTQQGVEFLQKVLEAKKSPKDPGCKKKKKRVNLLLGLPIQVMPPICNMA